jgi:hypothetical protein
MELGGLDQQTVIKGELAYHKCKLIGRHTIEGTEYTKYFERYSERDTKARDGLKYVEDVKGLYIEDVIREGELGRWKIEI